MILQAFTILQTQYLLCKIRKKSLRFRNSLFPFHQLCRWDTVNTRVVGPRCGSCRTWLGSAYSPCSSSYCHSWLTLLSPPTSVSFAWLLRLILRPWCCMLRADSTEPRPLTCLSLPSRCRNITPHLTWAARYHTHMRDNLCYSANGLRPSLAENQADVRTQVFWVFYEAEPNNCLVACTQVIFRHRHNGCRLPYTSHMDWMHMTKHTTYYNNHKIKSISHWLIDWVKVKSPARHKNSLFQRHSTSQSLHLALSNKINEWFWKQHNSQPGIIKLLRRFCYFVHECTQCAVNLTCTLTLLMIQTANLLWRSSFYVSERKQWTVCVICTCRHATKNSTARQPTTAHLLVMATNSSIAFTDIAKKCEVSCTECTGQGNDFELMPMAKLKLDFL